MKWLKQQSKVEALSAASLQHAEHMSAVRRQLHSRVHARVQQPGTLAWAFAGGALVGATRGGEPGPDRLDLFRYMNTAALLWSLISGQMEKS